MSAAPRVLALDIEGGHGGSSRSLYHVLRHLPRDAAELEVWCRRPGPLQDGYAALGIPSRVEPGMPKVSAVPRLSRNLYLQARYSLDFLRSKGFRQRLLQAAAQVDVVHLNHETLAHLGAWLRPRTRAAIVVHNRTMLRDTWFARRQMRQMAAAADHLVFITENEESNVRLMGVQTPGSVIYNVVEVPATLPAPHPDIPQGPGLRVACLSNYSWMRGVDRLVDVAVELRASGGPEALFVVAGDMRLTRALPGDLGRIGARGGSLKDYARLRGVADRFLFLGHVSEPERVLAGCHALVKPTREDNPWGRDILEAMALGRPAISVGSYARFVSPGETGVLLGEYTVQGMAQALRDLTNTPGLVEDMGRRARERVAGLCHGPQRAGELAQAWSRAVTSRNSRSR